jgi:hypothetical protein
MQTDIHVSISIFKPSQCIAELQLLIHNDMIHTGDLQFTDEFALVGPHVRIEFIDVIKQPLRCLVDHLTVIGHPEPGATSLAKSHAKPFLQFGHVTTERGLTHVEFFLRINESTAVYDCHEHAEETEIDLANLIRHDPKYAL